MPEQTGTGAVRKHAVARPRSLRQAPRIVVDAQSGDLIEARDLVVFHVMVAANRDGAASSATAARALIRRVDCFMTILDGLGLREQNRLS